MTDERFVDRITELMESVGSGQIVGRVTFDQVYARYQHEDMTLNHPRGGGAKYLSRALQKNLGHFRRTVADAVLHGSLVDAVRDATERVADEASGNAPIEFGDLRQSHSVRVTDKGSVVYDRPAFVPRLSDDVLIAKMRARKLWGPNE